MSRPDYSRVAILVVLAVVLYYVFRILEPFLDGIIGAAILATAFYPLFKALQRRLKRPRLAGALACVLLTVGLVLPAVFIFSTLARESVTAFKAVDVHAAPGSPHFLAGIQNSWWLVKARQFGLEPDFRSLAARAIGLVSGFLVSRGASIFSGVADVLVNLLVMLLIFYYLLVHGIDIVHQLQQLSPLRSEHEEVMIEKFRGFARSIFWGILVTSVFHGIAGGLIFLIAGLPSPLLWGAIIALVSLVPVVGTALVWGPLVVYYLLTGAVLKGVVLAIAFTAAVSVVDYVLRPLVMKRGMEISTLWTLLSIIGGVEVFGILGLFLGPFLLALLLALLDVYKVEFRRELGGV